MNSPAFIAIIPYLAYINQYQLDKNRHFDEFGDDTSKMARLKYCQSELPPQLRQKI